MSRIEYKAVNNNSIVIYKRGGYRTVIPTHCKNCGKLFYEEPNVLRKGHGLYCSLPCRNYKHNNPNWKGGIPYHIKYPERTIAINTVTKALKEGTIVRQSCEVCDNPKTEAHHNDYTKPLEVNWLCKKCHEDFHVLCRQLLESEEGV